MSWQHSGSIWKNRFLVDFWSFFDLPDLAGSLWDCLKGFPFVFLKGSLKTRIFKSGTQLQPFEKIREGSPIVCNRWRSHKFQANRSRFRRVPENRTSWPNAQISAHMRARGKNLKHPNSTNFDFAPYMKSKFSILLSTPPKSGAADSVLTFKIDFKNI